MIIVEPDYLKFRHKKTGNIYLLLEDYIINCTNAQDGELMVRYKNEHSNTSFVRERTEFYEKFERVENEETTTDR